jgi:hypothetical protein
MVFSFESKNFELCEKSSLLDFQICGTKNSRIVHVPLSDEGQFKKIKTKKNYNQDGLTF